MLVDTSKLSAAYSSEKPDVMILSNE